MSSRTTSPYRNHRFPPEIIAHAVWLYHRFSLSFRAVPGCRFLNDLRKSHRRAPLTTKCDDKSRKSGRGQLRARENSGAEQSGRVSYAPRWSIRLSALSLVVWSEKESAGGEPRLQQLAGQGFQFCERLLGLEGVDPDRDSVCSSLL